MKKIFLPSLLLLAAIALHPVQAKTSGSFQSEILIKKQGQLISQGVLFRNENEIRMDLRDGSKLLQTQIFDFKSNLMMIIFEKMGFYFEMPLEFNALAPKALAPNMTEACHEELVTVGDYETTQCTLVGTVREQKVTVDVWRAKSLNNAVIKTHVPATDESMELTEIKPGQQSKKLFAPPKDMKRFRVDGGPQEMLTVLKGMLK